MSYQRSKISFSLSPSATSIQTHARTHTDIDSDTDTHSATDIHAQTHNHSYVCKYTYIRNIYHSKRKVRTTKCNDGVKDKESKNQHHTNENNRE